eukprot:COSAG01_NODE_57263_length_313_cov_0.957944_2_plen_41_part_01
MSLVDWIAVPKALRARRPNTLQRPAHATATLGATDPKQMHD